MFGRRNTYIIGFLVLGLSLVPSLSYSADSDVLGKVERLRKLKEENPEAYARVIERKKERLNNKIRQFQNKNPEKLQSFKKLNREQKQKRLQSLKENNPEKYERFMERRIQKFQQKAQQNPERAKRFLERNPNFKNRAEQYMQGQGKRFERLRSSDQTSDRAKNFIERKKVRKGRENGTNENRSKLNERAGQNKDGNVGLAERRQATRWSNYSDQQREFTHRTNYADQNQNRNPGVREKKFAQQNFRKRDGSGAGTHQRFQREFSESPRTPAKNLRNNSRNGLGNNHSVVGDQPGSVRNNQGFRGEHTGENRGRLQNKSTPERLGSGAKKK